MNVLVGTQFYAADGDAERRQANCAASLRALRDAETVNVQWREGVCVHEGIETLPLLTRDASAVVGANGRRKPIVVDLLDVLAAAASRRGLRYFLLVNGDVIVTQAAVDRIGSAALQTYAFSRMDFDAASRSQGEMMIWGVDAFGFDVAWWQAHRPRFRTYVLGEPCFDNVFAAIMMAHGSGAIVNRDPDIRHERHPSQAGGSYARYNFYLAALDAPYFSMWARYVDAVQARRRDGALPDDDDALRRGVFVRRRSAAGAIWHAGRCARASWRYARDRARISATAGAALR